MNYMTFNLDHGYLSHFLVSDVRKEEVEADPVKIESAQNVWIGSTAASSHINPIRTAFLEKVKKNGIKDVEVEDFQPGGKVKLLGKSLTLGYRVPFGDPVIGHSFFYSTPLWIALTALTILESPDERDIILHAAVKGGISLYVDGEEKISFRPYKRNESIEEDFVLHLKKGRNELHLIIDEFAERDTECTASLRVVSGFEGLKEVLPFGNRDTEKIKRVERAMEALAFTRNNYLSGHIMMMTTPPEENSEFVLHIKGATEENTFLNIYHEEDVVFKKGESTADLGEVESFPVGFLRFNVTTIVENLTISTVRTVESFPLSFLDEPSPTVKERKMQAFSYLAKYGEQNANRAMALLFTNGDKDEIETILRRQLDFINKRSDCSDFYLSYFPFMIRHFSDSGLIRKETLSDMKKCILSFRYWHDEPGDDAMWFYSENHALMFHVCELLCGELYPDEVFTNSNMTGREKQNKAIELLRPWFETFFKTGFTEWNSPPYLPIDALGFASLYAQTENSEMKEYASRALDYIFRLLAITSFNGVFSTTSGRTYLKEIFGNHSNCPSFINWIGYAIGNESHAGKGVVPFCFSDYEPKAEYKSLHTIEKGNGLYWKSTHGYNGYADITVYKTSSYLLSAANNFCPGRRGFQEDVVHAVFSADEHVFINHPGEFALFGYSRPSYWAGSGTLPRVNEYKGFASVIYRVNPDHPVDFTHAYFPTFEFVRTEEKGGWYFALSHSGALIAIYSSNGLTLTPDGPNGMRELVTPGRNVVWLIKCSEIDKEKSLDAFIEKILSSEKKINSSSLSYSFDDPDYGRLEAGFDFSLTLNGLEEKYKGYDHYGTIEWDR